MGPDSDIRDAIHDGMRKLQRLVTQPGIEKLEPKVGMTRNFWFQLIQMRRNYKKLVGKSGKPVDYCF